MVLTSSKLQHFIIKIGPEVLEALSKEGMLQLDFVTKWTHAELKAVFHSSCGFPSLDMFQNVALTSMWT